MVNIGRTISKMSRNFTSVKISKLTGRAALFDSPRGGISLFQGPENTRLSTQRRELLQFGAITSYSTHEGQARNQGGRRPPRKLFAPFGKCAGHSVKLLVIAQKIWAPPENFSPLLGSQAGYGPDEGRD